MIARNALSSPIPHQNYPLPQAWSAPIPFPLVPYECPMQSSHDWHIQRVAEDSAHLEQKDQPFVWYTSCDHCCIGIGSGHVEQDLYCYFITNRQNILCMVNGSEKCVNVGEDGQYFFCCGSCARYRSRQLPEVCCLFTRDLWTTDNILLQHEQTKPLSSVLRTALTRYRRLFLTWIMMPFCLRFSIPLSSLFCLPSKKRKDKRVEPQTTITQPTVLPTRPSFVGSGFIPRPRPAPVSLFS